MSISVIGGSCFTVKELKLHKPDKNITPRTEDRSNIAMSYWNQKVQEDVEVEPNMSLAYWNKKVEEELEEKQKKVSLLREEIACIEDGSLLRRYQDPTDEEDSSSGWGGSHPVMDICSFSTVVLVIVIVIIIFALIVKYSKYVNGKL